MDFSKLASDKTLAKTVKALKKNNIEVFVANNKKEALGKLKSLIPDGAEVMTASSKTLDEIGFTQLLKSGKHPWKNLKQTILEEKDPVKQKELRRKFVTADYFLGSVHAITSDGQVLTASASGSQLPAYAYSSPHVLWVAGTQKIVADFNLGIKRIEEYCLPLESERMKRLGYSGSSLNKILLIKKEYASRLKLILVKEALGF